MRGSLLTCLKVRGHALLSRKSHVPGSQRVGTKVGAVNRAFTPADDFCVCEVNDTEKVLVVLMTYPGVEKQQGQCFLVSQCLVKKLAK